MVEGTDFRTVASELPENIFTVLHKPNKALSPVSIVATVDPDGAPHTAPFGSMRAVTPRLLRFASLRQHDTYVNLLKDDRVMVAFVASRSLR
jgi:flavin reductase (DIM6/NTAB) family NADH-FMN oxidoreductase RutF